MPILGLSIGTIEANREEKKVSQEVKVNSTPRILDVKEADVPNIDKKVLSVDFEFVTIYEPDFGRIVIKGKILYLTGKNKAVMDEWKKKKHLPEEISLELFNYIFRRCLLKASLLAEDLQLPPPMPMPKVSPKKESK